MEKWYTLDHPEQVASPALLIYIDRVRYNIELMIEIAGDVSRLRPHVKTHKLPELIEIQVSYGIKKFKCATIAEAEMVAQNGGEDILLAYQPVGPNIERFITLTDTYPDTHFSTVVDCLATTSLIAQAAEKYKLEVSLYLDIDDGMHRTGVSRIDEAISLVEYILKAPGLHFEGLHVYDGHIHESDPVRRQEQCLSDFEKVNELIRGLKSKSIDIPHLITGGTPTFPIHAQFADRELSPGTPLLWDMGYSTAFKDLKFKHAAVLLSRIISKPQAQYVCLDLGYKAIASEMSHPRVQLMSFANYNIENHSEEHLVVKIEEEELNIGDVVYGIPTHICPTVALYEDTYIIENHKIIDNWKILARRRSLTV